MPTTAAQSDPPTVSAFLDAWPLWIGLAALALPTAFSLMQTEWTRDSGSHEPIVLVVSAWLLWRKWPRAGAPDWAAQSILVVGLLLMSLATYAFGRAYDFSTLEVSGLYGAGLAALFARFGFRVVRGLWFPIIFLAFAIPPPHALLDVLTQPLKELVSYLATAGLKLFGLPVGRQGVIIFVAQYELLIEDACSGLNSIVGLTALIFLYTYLVRNSSTVYSLFLACLAIPVAIIANVVRVALLVLGTYFLGDATAQGLAHAVAGVVLFATALALMFAIDRVAHWALSLARRP